MKKYFYILLIIIFVNLDVSLIKIITCSPRITLKKDTDIYNYKWFSEKIEEIFKENLITNLVYFGLGIYFEFNKIEDEDYNQKLINSIKYFKNCFETGKKTYEFYQEIKYNKSESVFENFVEFLRLSMKKITFFLEGDQINSFIQYLKESEAFTEFAKSNNNCIINSLNYLPENMKESFKNLFPKKNGVFKKLVSITYSIGNIFSLGIFKKMELIKKIGIIFYQFYQLIHYPEKYVKHLAYYLGKFVAKAINLIYKIIKYQGF